MTKAQAAAVIAHSVEQAQRLIAESEKLAREHDITFTYEIYGHGPTTNDEDGWMSSSRRC